MSNMIEVLVESSEDYFEPSTSNTVELLELYRQDVSLLLRENENANILNFSDWKEINKDLFS